MIGSAPNWEPFRVVGPGVQSDAIRPLHHPEGISDRLRLVSFAELQASVAFEWAISTFSIPQSVKGFWQQLAQEEYHHHQMLLDRLIEIGGRPEGRILDNSLWIYLTSGHDPIDFTHRMAGAETRGRTGGYQLHQTLRATDPASAEVFREIAHDEDRHIEIAKRNLVALQAAT